MSEPVDGSKSPAPSAQCYLGFCYSELARVLGSKRQPFTRALVSSCHKHTRMQGPQPVQPLLELWTQTIVRLNLIREQSISACRWRIENIKERSPRWLILIRHVRMPGDGICPRFEKIHCSIVIRTAMDQVHFWIALRGATSGVNVQTPEVRAEI